MNLQDVWVKGSVKKHKNIVVYVYIWEEGDQSNYLHKMLICIEAGTELQVESANKAKMEKRMHFKLTLTSKHKSLAVFS